MITSKLTSKMQTTIPQPVRTALGVREGDALTYAIEGDYVVVRKLSAAEENTENPFATFGEWDSEADRKAYADL